MKRYFLFFFILLFSISFSQHQFLKISKLEDEDVKSTAPTDGSDIPAEFLHKSVSYFINNDGFIEKKYKERIKIYNKDLSGKLLNKEIFVRDGNPRQTISGLKAYTYNYENGKVESTKVDKESQYKSNEDKEVNVTKFAFPNVKNGSVVEYEYTITSPPDFLIMIPTFVVEEDVPIRYAEYVLDCPTFLAYNLNYSGELTPTYRDYGSKNIYGGSYYVYRFAYKNVPAFKSEKFVLNSENQKTSIRCELNSTNFNNQYKSYAMNWQDIKIRLLESEYFGEQLKKENLIKDILSNEIKTKIPVSSRAAEILKYVQSNYTWNKETGIFTEKGIRNLLSTKTGNAAEINLLLIMLLRNAGIPTDPLILPTLDRGKLTSYSPSITVPNYLLAAVSIDGKYTLFDATSKHSSPNIIPPRGLNYSGVLLGEKEAKIVDIFYPDRSQTILTVDAELNPDGTFKGHFSDKDTKLFGLMTNELFDKNKEDFVKTYKDKYKFKLSNIDSHTIGEGDFETTLDFTSDIFVDNIGGKLVFNPLLFLYTQEHDFSQKEERKSPIEFLSGNERIKKVTISLPENFIFENIPTSKKFRTEDNSIIYSYKINKINDNKIVVETSTLIDAATFPKEYYPAFKQIFDNITKLEGQVVTVVKKK